MFKRSYVKKEKKQWRLNQIKKTIFVFEMIKVENGTLKNPK